MIPLLGAQDAIRLRYGAPTIVDFQPVRLSPTSTTIRATFAPASYKTLQRAPNGIAVRDLVDVVSYDELRAAAEGSNLPDRVVFDGAHYEVQWVTRQPPFLGQPEHWEAAALRVQAIEIPQPEVV